MFPPTTREWLSGRALPCQGKCREFESRFPLQIKKAGLRPAFFIWSRFSSEYAATCCRRSVTGDCLRTRSCIVFLTNTLLYSRLVLAKNTMQDFPTTRTPIFSMIFGKDERRRTFRTSSEYLSKSAEIAAFWRVLTQLPVTEFERKRKCCRSVLRT